MYLIEIPPKLYKVGQILLETKRKIIETTNDPRIYYLRLKKDYISFWT